MSETTKTRIFIAGYGLRGSGYPNAWNTIRMLAAMPDVEIIECGTWIPEGTHLWRVAKGPRLKALLLASRLLLANMLSAARLLMSSHREDVVYIPYPSIFLLWMISWVPGNWRSRYICDAYITIWDTLYQDRNPGMGVGRVARFLLRLESRALRAAEIVLVDTQANAEHVSRLFNVPIARIRAVPLALDVATYSASEVPGAAENKKVRVLFIGTFVPLQGAVVVARAIHALREAENLEFVLIGDGQQAREAARWLQNNPAVIWLRGWQPPQVLARELVRADICLGIFGGEGKASRVLPFKLYMAMAAGKAVITQRYHGTPAGVPPAPVVAIDAAPDALAVAIQSLAADGVLRDQLARQAKEYFHQYLSLDELERSWVGMLQSLRCRK